MTEKIKVLIVDDAVVVGALRRVVATDLDGTDIFIESCREECGLEPDVTRGMVEKAFTEAEEFSQLLQ